MDRPAPIYTVDEIRRIEQLGRPEVSAPTLMARAGAAAAELGIRLIAGRGKRILTLVGPGNNGGDALEVATHLKRRQCQVSCVFAGETGRLPTDAAVALDKWRGVGGELLAEIPPGRHWDLVIDGLFGIGLTRAPVGRVAELIEQANAIECPRLALDIASGVNADTGEAPGATFDATHTITFIALKPGLLTLDGPDHCGELHTATLDLDAPSLLTPRGALVDASILAMLPGPRPQNFHKGMAGSVAVIGGAPGMVGAVLLAARAALKLGAGKVFAGLASDAGPTIDPLHPELMIRRAEALLTGTELDAVAVGPGLGTDGSAQRLVSQAMRLDVPIVVDADALNLIASFSVLQTGLLARTAPTILTPHPAEAARLLQTKTADVQADRVRAAKEIAQRLKSFVVLKGNGSVLANPGGDWWINHSGNPGMASGGMGDTLTGLITSLLAQGVEADVSMRAGVYVHGAAADRAVATGAGPIGLTAGELIDHARALVNRT